MKHTRDDDMSNISFLGANRGLQVGVNTGQISSSFSTYNQNTQVDSLFIGDITAGHDIYINNTINKAYHLFQSSLDAPSLFNQVQSDLGILNSILTLTRQRFREYDPGETEYQTLNAVLRSCNDIFTDLSQIKERFDNIDLETQVKFERFGYGVEQIQDIRARITTNIQALNLLISEITRSSQTTVERLLRKFIGDIRVGKRDVSRFSQASLTEDEAEAWRLIRKDLQSIGLTPDAFQKHHDFIVATLRDSLPVFGITIPEDTVVPGNLRDEVYDVVDAPKEDTREMHYQVGVLFDEEFSLGNDTEDEPSEDENDRPLNSRGGLARRGATKCDTRELEVPPQPRVGRIREILQGASNLKEGNNMT